MKRKARISSVANNGTEKFVPTTSRYQTQEYREWHAGYETRRRNARIAENPSYQKDLSAKHRDYAKRNPSVILTCRENDRCLNERSMERATMRRERWGVVEDAMLLDENLSGSELAKLLGRTIQGIRKRRQKVRKNEESAICPEQVVEQTSPLLNII